MPRLLGAVSLALLAAMLSRESRAAVTYVSQFIIPSEGFDLFPFTGNASGGPWPYPPGAPSARFGAYFSDLDYDAVSHSSLPSL